MRGLCTQTSYAALCDAKCAVCTHTQTQPATAATMTNAAAAQCRVNTTVNIENTPLSLRECALFGCTVAAIFLMVFRPSLSLLDKADSIRSNRFCGFEERVFVARTHSCDCDVRIWKRGVQNKIKILDRNVKRDDGREREVPSPSIPTIKKKHQSLSFLYSAVSLQNHSKRVRRILLRQCNVGVGALCLHVLPTAA